MKHKLLFLIFLFNIGATFAQRSGNLTIYSNTGKKFFVVLNGIRQNMEPETNVNISGLTENWYSCRIMAEDKSFDIEKNVGVKKDTVITYRLVKKRKKYKLRFYNQTSLGIAPEVENQTRIAYRDSNQSNGDATNSQLEETVKTDTQSTETTSTTTTSINSKDGTTTYTEESTSTTSTNQTDMEEGNIYTDDDVTMTLESGGCSITDEEYLKLKSQIENEAFSDDKMQIAKQAASNKCMTVDQIKQIALLFDFSENRLNFVKAAHLNCLNQKDYAELTEVFTFSADKKVLEKFLQSK